MSNNITKNTKNINLDNSIQLSVAISDFFLAFTCFLSVYLLYNYNDCFIDSICFCIIGIAASCGVIRFGIFPSFIPIHKFFTMLGSLSLGVIALSIYTFNDGDIVDRDTRLIGCIIILLVCAMPLYVMKLDLFLEIFTSLIIIVIGLCLILVIYKSFLLYPSDESKLFGIGVFLYLSSSLIVGTRGTYFNSIKRVDVFHIMLLLGNLAFTKGILLQRT